MLLAATDRGRDAHAAATAFLNSDERRLALAPQIVREYLAVATRPVLANGLAMPAADAISNIEQFLDDMELLAETAAATRRLLDLLSQGLGTGKQVHDANVVAVALAHQARTIVTCNTAHFERFAGLISVESPADNS